MSIRRLLSNLLRGPAARREARRAEIAARPFPAEWEPHLRRAVPLAKHWPAEMQARHRRLVRQMSRARRAAGYYRQGLARLEDKWPGTGATGERYQNAEHLYSGDLDLFGRGSLYQRLCTTQTRMGDDTLAAWLLEPADAATLRARHAAIDELRNEIDLR